MTPAMWTLAALAAAFGAAGAGYAVVLRRQRAHAHRVRRSTVETRAALQRLKERSAQGEISVDDYERERRRIVDALLKSTAVDGRSLAARSGLHVASAAVLVGALVAVYLMRDALFPPSGNARATAAAEAPRPALRDDQLERMVASAEEKTRNDPRDAAAWAMLAHSLDMLGKFAESSTAYARLVELTPGDAQTWADYADAMGVANGRRLAGRPSELIEHALALDPHNAKALALAGTAAFQREAYRDALGYWQRAQAASKDAKFRAELEASVRQARVALKEEPAPAAPASPGERASTVSGRVMIADELARTLPADATVFVFARPVSGSRMPVAIFKRRVKDLPMAFTLDDSMAMVPEAKLSSQAMVVVGARVSRDGDVMPKPGDAEGWSAPVPVGASGVKVEISEPLK